jgi:predicted RNA-binding protein with PIN domain
LYLVFPSLTTGVDDLVPDGEIMEIIIDGYNLMGNDQGLTGALEHRRQRLLQQLDRYQKAKGFGVSVVVVFDGWKEGRSDETRERAAGINVIFSRRGEKADAVVLRLARERGSGCVVVSSDREVRAGAEKIGATAIYAGEFNGILRRLDAPGDYDEEEPWDTQPLPKAERRRRDKLKKLRLP